MWQEFADSGRYSWHHVTLTGDWNQIRRFYSQRFLNKFWQNIAFVAKMTTSCRSRRSFSVDSARICSRIGGFRTRAGSWDWTLTMTSDLQSRCRRFLQSFLEIWFAHSDLWPLKQLILDLILSNLLKIISGILQILYLPTTLTSDLLWFFESQDSSLFFRCGTSYLLCRQSLKSFVFSTNWIGLVLKI